MSKTFPRQARKIPLEIAVTEDNFPMYSVTTEDDGRGYAATKLPFQVHNSVRLNFDEDGPKRVVECCSRQTRFCSS